jgi:hypothetical protein
MPSWQETVVTAYLDDSSITLPPAKYFNKSNRAFPDVSGLGHMYLMIMDGDWFQVDGYETGGRRGGRVRGGAKSAGEEPGRRRER